MGWWTTLAHPIPKQDLLRTCDETSSYLSHAFIARCSIHLAYHLGCWAQNTLERSSMSVRNVTSGKLAFARVQEVSPRRILYVSRSRTDDHKGTELGLIPAPPSSKTQALGNSSADAWSDQHGLVDCCQSRVPEYRLCDAYLKDRRPR